MIKMDYLIRLSIMKRKQIENEGQEMELKSIKGNFRERTGWWG